MNTFTDALNREWQIEITIGTARRVKNAEGVDLISALTGTSIFDLTSNPLKFCDVLFEILRPEAVKKNIDEQSFAEGLNGDAIESASKAFLEALIDFSPSPEARAALRARIKVATTIIRRKFESDMSVITHPDYEKTMEKAVDKIFGKSSTNTQGFLDSTPIPSPSADSQP